MPPQPDPRQPESEVKIRDFGGYAPNSDPHDVPPGSSISQVNVIAVRPGELRVRGGAAVVKFR